MKPIGELLRGISIETNTFGESTPKFSAATATDCPICHGAGYLRMDAPVDHPNFSRLLPCVCKLEEQRVRAQANVRAFSDLSAFRDLTFETFDPSVRGAKEAYELAYEYARNPDNWLLFVGPYGCGKTHLAAAIANYSLHQKQMSPILAVVPDLLDHLRTAFGPDSESTFDQRFAAFRTADLLILDDLGTENATPWAREKLFQIINYRYIERAPTVITTNDLDRAEGRIRSRLYDWQMSKLVYIDADDYRVRQPRSRRTRTG
jgi:DNA replication protein DnaC